MKLPDTIFLIWNFNHSLIFYGSIMFWKPALFLFIGKEVPNLVDLLRAILSNWAQ